MVEQNGLAVRPLRVADIPAMRRILETSEYTHVRFEVDELPYLIEHFPAFGLFSVPRGRLGRLTGGTLQAFLLVTSLVPPSAWIGGFGVTWSQGQLFEQYLDGLLPALVSEAAARGARMLYYSASDLEADWLRPVFEQRGYTLVSLLRSYDKVTFETPSAGNSSVTVRPFREDDVAGVVAVERQAFAQLWQYDAAGFLEVARTYPYFVVAEGAAGICGYQFNTIDGATGYLVRIAVAREGHGVGTRLMAEAIHYFEQQHVLKILLNTEEQNTRAHALYEWFGFERVAPVGFVVGRAIESDG